MSIRAVPTFLHNCPYVTHACVAAQACGCTCTVTGEEVEEGEVDKLAQRLVEHAEKVRS